MGGIWGERDALAAPYIDLRRATLQRFQPDVDFRVVAGAGHWVLYEAADAANAAIMDAVNRTGEVFLSHTRLRDRFTIRLSVGNLRTEPRHVERAWALLRDAAASS